MWEWGDEEVKGVLGGFLEGLSGFGSGYWGLLGVMDRVDAKRTGGGQEDSTTRKQEVYAVSA